MLLSPRRLLLLLCRSLLFPLLKNVLPVLRITAALLLLLPQLLLLLLPQQLLLPSRLLLLSAASAVVLLFLLLQQQGTSVSRLLLFKRAESCIECLVAAPKKELLPHTAACLQRLPQLLGLS